MKQLITALALLLAHATALAGLVSVNTSNYIRESGSAVTETLSITLENEGEIRIANVNLQDDAIEVAASTEVYLNGQPVLDPFYLPPGGSVVFPLEAGVHDLEVTVLGKPGGGIAVSFYENKPDAPVQGKGWELLDDGTVLHRKTGLIWHRNPKTPGLTNVDTSDVLQPSESRSCSGCYSVEDYVADLNAGFYGADAKSGNAGYSDWRVATPAELFSTLDHRAAHPAIADASGDAITFPWPRMGTGGGMRFGEPLYLCAYERYAPYVSKGWVQPCPEEFSMRDIGWITLAPMPEGEWGENGLWIGVFPEDGAVSTFQSSGFVWPVRGGPAN